MVTNLSSDPLKPQLALDSSEKRQLNWLAARTALLWAVAIGTAVALLAVIAVPGERQVLYDALWWYPTAFIVAFYLKRRVLLAKAQAMLDRTNARMHDEVDVQKMQPADAEMIVNAYGAVLAEPTALGIVRDARSLPRPKETIKDALKFALKMTTDAAMREHLKSAYVSLADFQHLSDNEVRALQVWHSASSQNKAAASDLEMADLAKRISADGEVVTAVQRRVADEAKSLLQELKVAGF
jgi:hypothetical protein